MKSFNQSIAIAIFAVSIAGVAHAQTEEDGADAMSGNAAQAAATSFNALDKDQDGYINAIEATGDSTLMEKWTEADANADRKIDETEFSKFEAMAAEPDATAPEAGMSQGMEEAQEQGMQQQEMPQQQDGAESSY